MSAIKSGRIRTTDFPDRIISSSGLDDGPTHRHDRYHIPQLRMVTYLIRYRDSAGTGIAGEAGN